MNQRTHSWIAIRAIALLEKKGEEGNLVQLLKPHARKASVGAWIPDDADAKRGGSGSCTENHIFKMKPYTGDMINRFITLKENLLDRIGENRMMYTFLQDDTTLDSEWWSQPYHGDVSKPGQHLPNRIMALSTMMKDLLLMGCKNIDHLLPGDLRFAQYLAPEVRTQEEAAAMYFFMLSHFAADACMPCHCDGRRLAKYDIKGGIHVGLESYWSRNVGVEFEKNNLIPKDIDTAQTETNVDQVLEQARDVDTRFSLKFQDTSIPDLHKEHDVWLEMIYQCRASFAVASIIAPCQQYRYDAQDEPLFKDVLDKTELLNTVNTTVMHDAVLNTAILWKHIWNKVKHDEPETIIDT